MRRLAARSRARIEHAHAIARTEQRRRELRRRVLHRERAFCIPRQGGHRPRRIDADARASDSLRADAVRLEQCDESLGRDSPHVGAQTKRRSRVARVENLGKALRVFGAHALDPPARVGKSRFRIVPDLREHRGPAAQEMAQDRIDQAFGRGASHARGRPHCAIDHDVGRSAGMDELVERDPEQRLDVRVGERPIGKRTDDRFQLPEEAQRSVGELVDQGAVARRGPTLGCQSFRERRTREYPPYCLGRDALRTLHRGGSKSPTPPSRAVGECAPRSADVC